MLEQGVLNFPQVRPWWLRVLLIFALAYPLLFGGTLHGHLHPAHYYTDLRQWTLYAVGVSLFVVVCVGFRRFFDWLTVAFILGLTIVFTGAFFRKLGLWDSLVRLTGGTPTDPTESLMDLSFRLVVILVSYPLALLAIQSFPAADVMRSVSRLGATKSARLVVILAVVLRMIQHVSEVVNTSLLAWREENPQMLLPRFRRDWHGSPLARVGVVDWLRVSVIAWALAITVRSLEAVPGVVRDFRRLSS